MTSDDVWSVLSNCAGAKFNVRLLCVVIILGTTTCVHVDVCWGLRVIDFTPNEESISLHQQSTYLTRGIRLCRWQLGYISKTLPSYTMCVSCIMLYLCYSCSIYYYYTSYTGMLYVVVVRHSCSSIVCSLFCVHISDSSHYIEHYIHYYIIIVRLCACHVPIRPKGYFLTWLDFT